MGTLSRELIVGAVHAIILASSRPQEAKVLALTRCGGAKWLRSFTSTREILRCHVAKRPIEVERAQKAQPEYTVMFFRMQLYTHGLCHIHRALASGRRVEGWKIDKEQQPEDDETFAESGQRVVVRDQGPLKGSNDWSDDVLSMGEVDGLTAVFVKPLGEPLVFVCPENVINGDEKPLNPDSVEHLARGTPVALGRTSNWTVTPFINAAGELVLTTLIVRGESVSNDSLADMVAISGHMASDLGLSATKKGSTDDDVFFNTFAGPGGLVDCLERRKLSLFCPAIIILDGHASRLTENLARYLANHSIYAIIMPSHTSMIHQACDNGKMKLLETTFSRIYIWNARISGVINTRTSPNQVCIPSCSRIGAESRCHDQLLEARWLEQWAD